MSVPNLPPAPFKSIYASVAILDTDPALAKNPNNIDAANATHDPVTASWYLPFRQPIAWDVAIAVVTACDTWRKDGPLFYRAANVQPEFNLEGNAIGVHVYWFSTDTGGTTKQADPERWHFAVFDVGNVRPFQETIPSSTPSP